jgi:hypothetical protein
MRRRLTTVQPQPSLEALPEPVAEVAALPPAVAVAARLLAPEAARPASAAALR